MKEIAHIDARLAVVSFAPLDRLREWVPYFQEHLLEPSYRQSNLSLPPDIFSRTRFVSDATLDVYHAYGMGRNSPLKVYGPRIIWQYFRWGLEGKPIRKPFQDTLQRGGDFVVGRDGLLTLAHVGRDQADRPSIAEILTALKKT